MVLINAVNHIPDGPMAIGLKKMTAIYWPVRKFSPFPGRGARPSKQPVRELFQFSVTEQLQH